MRRQGLVGFMLRGERPNGLIATNIEVPLLIV